MHSAHRRLIIVSSLQRLPLDVLVAFEHVELLVRHMPVPWELRSRAIRTRAVMVWRMIREQGAELNAPAPALPPGACSGTHTHQSRLDPPTAPPRGVSPARRRAREMCNQARQT